MVDPGRLQRNRWIDRQINERALTAPGDVHAYHNDLSHHLQIDVMADMLKALDLAMEIEGVPHLSRDRVLHTMLFGEPPSTPGWPDPAEAQQRIANAAAFEAAMRTPAQIRFTVDESGNIQRKEDQP